ncbi:endonuclease Q family protein [Patescibacteria group bacterium]|nr:endonuclease Q family protein [Patescibacteria group bacterium]
MQLIADLQIHSKYSRAVSQKMDLFEVATWADKKGIGLMATGDWTHPFWFQHIKDTLEETRPGIFRIKNKPYKTRFFLSTEISSIYSQGGQTRRIHNLIFSPNLSTCEKIIKEMQRRGCNLRADGRPIVGLSSKELLEMVLEIDDRCLFIPAHAWTPWFAIFGSKSGFSSIRECFGDLEKHIYAVETGLSSDPIMNWQIAELDHRSLVSFSDAHSAPKIGREATVFVTDTKNGDPPLDFNYQDVADAIKQTSTGRLKIGYTVEFFPEEGKYHWSGHRSCNVKYSPDQLDKNGKICPVCHQPLTIGVENQVRDRSTHIIHSQDLVLLKNAAGLTFVYDQEKKRRPFVSIVPLLEVLSEINHGSAVKALREYDRLTANFTNEFDLLLRQSYEEIERAGGLRLRQAIEIVRNRQVVVDPGYDGVFGVVKIFSDQKESGNDPANQPSLF